MINRGDIHIRLDDGSEIVVSLPARQLKLVSTTLSRLLPGVAFGYTPERERQYLEDRGGCEPCRDAKCCVSTWS
ncbi:MAG: hypothetical protein IPN33_17915 [Saprospiraceae bacterium]|nr:hypothetical protein [Saprospiraceae bacterium]